MQSEYELCGHSDLEKEILSAAMAGCPAWHQPESIAKIIILWLLGEGLLCARLCVWVHSHKVHVIQSACYYLVFRKETEAPTSRDVAIQGHRTCKWPRKGWHLYLSASRPFHYTLFPRGWKTLQQSSCEITVRSICAEPARIVQVTKSSLPGFHPHVVEWSWFTFLRKQSNYPSWSQRVPEGLN